MTTLAVENGHLALLQHLEDRRFTETKMQELPRVYNKFYESVRFRRAGAASTPEPFEAVGRQRTQPHRPQSLRPSQRPIPEHLPDPAGD